MKDQQWPYWMMALGVVLVLAVMWTLADRFLVPRAQLLRLLAVCSFLGLLLPYRWTGARLGMVRREWMLFHILGIGPWLFGLILGLNLLVHDTPVCSEHAITSASQSAWYYRVELADDAFTEFPRVRRFEVERLDGGLPSSLRICKANGLFGVEVIVSRSLR